MWMALGADPIVAKQIMEMVMEKLVIMAPYVDRKDPMVRGGTAKVATNQPLAVSHYSQALTQHVASSGFVDLINPRLLVRFFVSR